LAGFEPCGVHLDCGFSSQRRAIVEFAKPLNPLKIRGTTIHNNSVPLRKLAFWATTKASF
jgi:hypothetical protein